MQRSTLKALIAGLAFFTLACNNDSEKVTVQEVNTETIEQDTFAEPPPPPPKIPPPKVEMIPAPKECFVNDGLNYKTTITVIFGGDDIMGSVTSEELESGKKETSSFEGTRKENKLMVRFKNDPPPIGASSEWLTTPWIIKRIDGKDILEIKFNAKNYDSNKWENTNYEFELTDCK